MSVFNDAPHLARAIESILSQSFRDFEFLIINDGSTDESPQIIDAFAARDDRIIALHQNNQGLIAGLNRGVAEAAAPLIARMDGDDIAHCDRFALQLARFEQDPRIGVLGTQAEFVDEAGAPATEVRYPLKHEDFPQTLRGPLFLHPSVMMQRDLVREVGGYRSAYKHCEDLDLWLRLYDRCRFENLPQRLLTYQRSAGQVSRLYLSQQLLGTEIAYASLAARRAGRPDPTSGMTSLPPLDLVDQAFGQDGLAQQMRATVSRLIVNSPTELRGAGFSIILDHAGDVGRGYSVERRAALWRTCLRLIKIGELTRAARLAMRLAFG